MDVALIANTLPEVPSYTESIWWWLDPAGQYILNTAFGPFIKGLESFVEIIGNFFPVEMVTICLSSLTVLLIIRVLHGASSGG